MAYNPNSRTSVYYDFMESDVSYQEQTLAFGSTDPFCQLHRDTTRVESRLMATNLALSTSTYKDLKREKSSGEIKVDVHFRSRVRLKVAQASPNFQRLDELVHVFTCAFDLKFDCEVGNSDRVVDANADK
ncbi:hypothetical protein V6N12_051522 [Hibiscus sabdariffa]|uniref:Late embryogenesis abundant protein LEA-2 subgroup domain-containing protein n=1 Tax=Hibiscus sabdariffa TaxID=183260 RepID=A0ABR2GFJ4_9ROSI